MAKSSTPKPKRSRWLQTFVMLCPGKELVDEIAGEEQFNENSFQIKQTAWRALVELDEIKGIIVLKNDFKIGVYIASMRAGKTVDLTLVAQI